jgi:hypothetical protein
MRVSVLSFGSVWRRRLGKDLADPKRFARAAYFNTTGVMVQGKLRTRPRIIGHARFNGVGGFNPNYPARIVGRVFECDEPSVWQGQNKMFCNAMLPSRAKPDRYLLSLRAAEFGRLMVGLPGWSSDDVWVIALSEWQEEQEGLLLMAAHGWVRTSVGKYSLKPVAYEPRRARLELTLAEEI